MGLVQTNSGTFNGASFTVTLPVASSASNCLVVYIAGNTVVNTPASWTLRTSSVVSAGLYHFERAAFSTASIAFTNTSGQGNWFIAEINAGSYIAASATGGQINGSGTTFASATTTPTAGTREEFAMFGSLQAGTGVALSVSSVTGGFTKIRESQLVVNDGPEGALATIDDVAANGSTAYGSTATWSADTNTRGALVSSYATTAAATAARPGLPTRRFWRAAHRSANI